MKDHLRAELKKALAEVAPEEKDIEITLETPKQRAHGDLSTSVALSLARILQRPPLKIAEDIAKQLSFDSNDVELVDVAAPGFINLHLGPGYRAKVLTRILSEGDTYARGHEGDGLTAQVEFVSANPTGPLTVGHGRNAVTGDTVANILEWNGYEVTREYYYNDAGRQMRLLGESVRVRYLEILGETATFPEDGYHGDYIRAIAQELVDARGDALHDEEKVLPFQKAAEEAVFADIKATLKRTGISMDVYSSEGSLIADGKVEAVVKELREADLAYEKDGAVWFKATDFGIDADRVLIKASGEPTYRLPDIAYHREKLRRNFHRVIDVLGADHHSAYPDVLAGLKALGHDTSPITVLFHQFVTLIRGGVQVKMSTRKADYVTLDDLIDEVGSDVARYFFLMRGVSSHLNFDLDLAVKESDENPVYYLQYAHARICSILRFAEEQGVEENADYDPSVLAAPEERDLIHILGDFPDRLDAVYRTLEPHLISAYLEELATAFHKFYTEHRVVTDDNPLTAARLVLVRATRTVLANGLAILGISAPEKM